MWTEIILFILIILLLRTLKKPSDYPPGPWGLPLFGFFPFGLKHFEDKVVQLRKNHGNIFSWRIGSQLIVFLNDFKLIKEAYNSPAFANRPTTLSFLSFSTEGFEAGLLKTNGVHWQNIRKFTLRHLRDLGMGKSKIVTAVQHEALEFVKELKKQAGKAAPLPRSLKPAVLNVLWQMIANKRYDYDHKTLIQFDNIMQKLFQNLSKLIILDIFPWLHSVIPKKIINSILKRELHIEMSNRMHKFFEDEIEEHLASLDETNPRDYIDEYLIEMEKQKENPESTMSIRDLVGCIGDLFGAGTETTAATIYFSIFYLAKFQKIQQKLQSEIDGVLPGDTLATLEDRASLPYTEAFINEILRHTVLGRYGIPRTVLADTTFEGYTIPKDSIIVSATAAIHYDPMYFESPEEFRPERFLNSERKLEISKAGLFPFGIGKRQCLGESMARMELFIFFTTVLKYINFLPPPDKEVDIRPLEIPVFNQPRAYQEVLITVRQ